MRRDKDGFENYISKRPSNATITNSKSGNDKGHTMSLHVGKDILISACTNEVKVKGEVRFLEECA